MRIREYLPGDRDQIVHLIAQFRVTLAGFKNIKRTINLKKAERELADFIKSKFPIFIAENSNGIIAGYIVCKVVDQIVWVESLFVSPEYRRKGVGSALFEQACKLAGQYGENTVYNWVHPNNDGMIAFLKSRGYDVLNLIEIRKPYRNEKFSQKMKVGNNEFNY